MKVRISILWLAVCLLSFSNTQAQNINIIPKPQEIIPGQETITIGQQLGIVSAAVSKRRYWDISLKLQNQRNHGLK